MGACLATFLLSHETFEYVREIRDSDCEQARKLLTKEEQDLIDIPQLLERAFERKEPLEVRRALEKVYPHLTDPDFTHEARRVTLVRKPGGGFVPLPSVVLDSTLSTKAQVKVDVEFPGAKIPPRDAAGLAARKALSRFVTMQLKDVRMVLWFSPEKHALLPAAYCLDLKTALLVKSFMTTRLLVCPHCLKMFVPSKTSVQYCCPAHRDAYRIARWRAKKKEEASTNKKRRKHGKG